MGYVARTQIHQSDRDTEFVILDGALVQFARGVIQRRIERHAVLPGAMFGEGAWNMLLDLFVKTAHQQSVSVTSLCIASGSPTSTALRYVQLLIECGLIQKTSHPSDKRSSNLTMTFTGLDKTVSTLRRMKAIDLSESPYPSHIIPRISSA